MCTTRCAGASWRRLFHRFPLNSFSQSLRSRLLHRPRLARLECHSLEAIFIDKISLSSLPTANQTKRNDAKRSMRRRPTAIGFHVPSIRIVNYSFIESKLSHVVTVIGSFLTVNERPLKRRVFLRSVSRLRSPLNHQTEWDAVAATSEWEARVVCSFISTASDNESELEMRRAASPVAPSVR